MQRQLRKNRNTARLFFIPFSSSSAVGPVVDGLQRRDQGLAPLGQSILHGRRDGRIDRAGDKSVALQLPQALGQHGSRDAHHLALQLPVTQSLVFHVRDVPQDGWFS